MPHDPSEISLICWLAALHHLTSIFDVFHRDLIYLFLFLVLCEFYPHGTGRGTESSDWLSKPSDSWPLLSVSGHQTQHRHLTADPAGPLAFWDSVILLLSAGNRGKRRLLPPEVTKRGEPFALVQTMSVWVWTLAGVGQWAGVIKWPCISLWCSPLQSMDPNDCEYQTIIW